ncbi:PREDICTED: voltage-dependent calcium channel type A subunit alpha-1-like [Dinoponera quadriceps]|uniref:Voltage-dependent calcium channel type A subunit alpha-1-like n=1 Tax=Dinoponera quadriceps TaxID=609295 RepID=A0A6P3XEV5_DINQU|nr:PREDICTED: voltage-dependent calcium channel type A subunit alpha-1-like [Dinoponera quadriceps]
MLGSVGGRHVSTRRRGSIPLVRAGVGLTYGATSGTGGLDGGTSQSDMPKYATRRRRAVTTSDHKSCALIQTRVKLGDIM